MSYLQIILFISIFIGDLIIPYILAPFYKGYSHRRMVMSSLGNPNSPVRHYYNAWLVIGGIGFLYSSYGIYQYYVINYPLLALILFICLLCFAVGAMILSGLFSVSETKEMTTLAAKIHGIGASIGFMTLLFVPLIIAIISAKEGHIFIMILSSISFVLAFIFFVLFIMADKPEIQNNIIKQEGSWQRLTLLWMYVPLFYICITLL